MKISAADLYRLRHAELAAQRAALRAQQAEQTFKELLLEMEQQYGLLGTTSSIDIHTGEVQASPANDRGPDIRDADLSQALPGAEAVKVAR